MSQLSALRIINELCMRFNIVDSGSIDFNAEDHQLHKDVNAPQQWEGTKSCDADLNGNDDNKLQGANEIFDHDIWKYQSEVFKSFNVCYHV